MKRIFLLILALCLCLTACGNNTSNTDNTDNTDSTSTVSDLVIPEDAGAPIAEAKNCKAVLQVQINPKFELYLNDEGKVIQLICLNDDAREAFADCEVIGLDSSDALQILLTAAQAQEYLNDSSTISITPVAVAEESSIQSTVDALPETVEYIRSKLNSAFSVLINHGDSDESENPNGYKLRTKKQDGILLLQYYRSDGTLAEEHTLCEQWTHIAYFRPDGTMYEARSLYLDGRFEQHFFDVNGKPFAINSSFRRGTLAEFPVNGGTMVINDTTYYPAAINTLTFRADGTLASWRAEPEHRPGSYLEKKYDANGVLIEETDHRVNKADWTEGDIITRFPTITSTFANGVRVSSTGTTPDGFTYSATYYPDGTPQWREVIMPDGSIIRDWYAEVSPDANDYINFITNPTRVGGYRIKTELVDTNGCLERSFYEAYYTTEYVYNNPRETYRYSADGTLFYYAITTTLADGSLARVAEYYGSDGTSICVTTTDSEWHRNEWTEPDGSTHGVEHNMISGVSHYWSRDADGNLLSNGYGDASGDNIVWDQDLP